MNTNDKINIPGVTLESGNGKLKRVVIHTNLCDGEMYLHGSHVTAFQPTGHKPVIWMSKASLFENSKPIRGGVPICFPWFGPKANDPTAPGHGFARLREWHLEAIDRLDDGSIRLTTSLKSDEATRKQYPFDFAAKFVATFGKTLRMELTVRNTGDTAATYQEALHTYFAVGDIKQVRVEGLENATYLDNKRNNERCQQSPEPIHFAGETDRRYVSNTAATTIVDPSMNRRIRIEKSGSQTTVVWNPWIAKSKAMPDFGDDEWVGMLCIETANSDENTIHLAPRAQHSIQAIISVE